MATAKKSTKKAATKTATKKAVKSPAFDKYYKMTMEIEGMLLPFHSVFAFPEEALFENKVYQTNLKIMKKGLLELMPVLEKIREARMVVKMA